MPGGGRYNVNIFTGGGGGVCNVGFSPTNMWSVHITDDSAHYQLTQVFTDRLYALYQPTLCITVRGNFAYASQVLCPQSVKLIENIEKVQRRATKFILNLGFMTNIPYADRLLNLDLLPITYWHEYLDLVLLYKIINNYTCIDDSARPIISRSRLTRSETKDNLNKFKIPFARTVTFQSSYFIRARKA